MNRKCFILLALVLLRPICAIHAQTVHRNIKTPEYRELQAKLATGWNTWYNNSFISQVCLPQAFAINLCMARPGETGYLRETFKAAAIQNRPETVMPGIRSDDGTYTCLELTYKGDMISVETAADGKDELILVTPHKKSKNYLLVEGGVLWNKEGMVGRKGNQVLGLFPHDTITVCATIPAITDAYAVTTTPHLTFPLDQEIGIYTGRTRTLVEIKSIIRQRHDAQLQKLSVYGELAPSYQAMQTILAWNTIYDAPNKRVITPVSRNWSHGWGGFVLFDWDTYFASYMLSQFNKDLAYANAIEITKTITPDGFIPNYQSTYGNTSWDRSQPPIGSSVILWMYNKYKEKWLLEEVYDELISWNRWWVKNRDRDGYLCWGSNPISDSLHQVETGIDIYNLEAAKLESGLDNSPMYDSLSFNPGSHTMELADVGLMSFYILDCHSLAAISTALGKNKEAEELNKRAAFYTKKLSTLWDEKTGIFLNKRLDNGEKSYRLSPTNFYPMLAKACTQKQAERMMKEHYFNPAEFYGEYVIPSCTRNDPAFKDNDYWRGRIWGPMNFLVYMGMRNYNVPEARQDLVKKSKALLMKNWNKDGGVYENYNSTSGEGGDVTSADGFYHWGALLTFIELIEKGYMD
ncbi:MGH1-like glycoside hydrolase domain-containing protein [Flavihumibacter profundi]|uniref:MGH1-like glycoside hydrolase domain-containing protein n=1 Tax=Flavihumibacter profundi TaxID=2716883 RepID=UPI001CC420E2|nr:trehalase family glycosidase [Flavihumibacter profundi]MBZ5856930.1 hypothetical protein [Flavihumibacter profundi]